MSPMQSEFPVDPSTPTLTAGERVFGTVELLDNIFQHLTPKNIFGIQLVSATVRGHIQGDTLTAKRLYLVATSNNTKLKVALNSAHGNDDFELPFIKRATVYMGMYLRYISVQLHSSDYLDANQSYGAMLLTQPPIEEMRVAEFLHRQTNRPKNALLRRAGGIKMKDLILAARAWPREAHIEFWASLTKDGTLECRSDRDGRPNLRYTSL